MVGLDQFTCSCPRRYSGPLCEVRAEPAPCRTCLDNDTRSGVDCGSSPCLNGATCLDVRHHAIVVYYIEVLTRNLRTCIHEKIKLNAKVSKLFINQYDTIRYDTRCYFNVRSKADISQLNLPRGTDN